MTSTFTRVVGMLVLGGVAVAAIVFLTIGFGASAVVEEAGERAERIGEKAIEAAREESRAHALAKDGWGFSDAAESSETDAADFEDESYSGSGDDWGAPAE